jgi:hypothetical protein
MDDSSLRAKPMLTTVFDGEEIIHRLLWRIAEQQVREAQERQEGWLYPSMVARVFAYHTVEAHLNYVGERIAPEIWVDEWNYFRNEPYRGALGKLRKVMDLVGLPWRPDDRPLVTVLELKEIRDLIAHGKAEKLRGEVIHPLDTNAPHPVSMLRERIGSKDTLAVVLPDVEEFLDAIQTRAQPLLKVQDAWFGDRALQGPAWHSSDLTTLNQ